MPRSEEKPLPRERCQKLEEEDVHSPGFASTNPETRSDAGNVRGAVTGLVVCGRKISTGVVGRPALRRRCLIARVVEHGGIGDVTKSQLTVDSKFLFLL